MQRWLLIPIDSLTLPDPSELDLDLDFMWIKKEKKYMLWLQVAHNLFSTTFITTLMPNYSYTVIWNVCLVNNGQTLELCGFSALIDYKNVTCGYLIVTRSTGLRVYNEDHLSRTIFLVSLEQLA